ncbi:hypothetical protein SETIT_7G304900v2 [Setaria italica]|uniref:Uncharacterized protein n=1 Tax=Setaria italica TaxID=4555 RepID=A0A368S1B6_SETIT|nr:hypothetical protein SETIT_7G304900v2 [Setaria italica]
MHFLGALNMINSFLSHYMPDAYCLYFFLDGVQRMFPDAMQQTWRAINHEPVSSRFLHQQTLPPKPTTCKNAIVSNQEPIHQAVRHLERLRLRLGWSSFPRICRRLENLSGAASGLGHLRFRPGLEVGGGRRTRRRRGRDEPGATVLISYPNQGYFVNNRIAINCRDPNEGVICKY